MSRRILTSGEKQQILELRETGVAPKEIAQQVRCSRPAVYRILKAGIAQEKAQTSCSLCGVSVPANSRFCFMCGAKILTRAEQICEDLSGITSMYVLLPDEKKDRFIHAINSAIVYIKEEPTDE